MAARPRFNTTTLGAVTDRAPLVATTIEEFAYNCSNLLYEMSVLDANYASEPARALLDIANWYAYTLLPNLVNRIRFYRNQSQAQRQAIIDSANTGIRHLSNNVDACLGLIRANGTPAYVMSALTNIPAASPFEIYYEAVLDAAAPASHAVAFAAIQAAALLLRWPAHSYRYGLPKVFWLCHGQNGTGANLSVITCSDVEFRHRNLEAWALRMRQSMITQPYRGQVVNLSNINYNSRAALLTAWNNPAPGVTRDASIMQRWTAVTGAAAVVGPITYNLPTGRACPYAFWQHPQARARCKRCRVVYRYTMMGEPIVYNDGPFFDRLTCAEVWGHLKGVNAGMV